MSRVATWTGVVFATLVVAATAVDLQLLVYSDAECAKALVYQLDITWEKTCFSVQEDPPMAAKFKAINESYCSSIIYMDKECGGPSVGSSPTPLNLCSPADTFFIRFALPTPAPSTNAETEMVSDRATRAPPVAALVLLLAAASATLW